MAYMKNIKNHPSYLISIIAIGLVAIILWMSFSRIDEITKVQGQVIALERTQEIQSINSGELEQINVIEGERVDKGEILASLDEHHSKTDYQEALTKVMALRAQLVRLSAEVFNRELKFNNDFTDWPEFVTNQKDLFDKRRKVVMEAVSAQKRILDNIRKEIAITQPLVNSGDVGKLEILRLRRQESETIGQMMNLQNQYFQDTQTQMTKAEEDLASQNQVLEDKKDILEHSNIRASMNGIVKNIKIHTAGAAIRPGDTLMELVPDNGGLIVEAKLAPKDIAFIKPGLPATIKLDAYDYSIYGEANGIVSYISPDVINNEDQHSKIASYYRVLIKVTQVPEKLFQGMKIDIQPGMTTQVDIKTGTRSVLQYLIKPLIKTVSESMSER